jgi:hypothetical protein
MRNSDYLYIFLHVPRTAGTTFVHHLEKNFKEKERIRLYPDTLKFKRSKVFYNYNDYWKIVENYLSGFSRNQKEKIKVIYGHHLPYGVHKFFNKPARYITFIRDPIKRSVSLYNFWSTSYFNENPKGRKRLIYKYSFLVDGGVVSFEKWLKQKYEEDNHLTAAISLGRFFTKFGYLQENKKEERSILSMLDKFYFVGITENFEQDSLYLYWLLEINKFFIRQNVSKKYFDLKNKESVKIPLSKYRLDLKIYKNALKRSKEFKKTNPEFGRIVKNMRIKRGLLLPFTQVLCEPITTARVISKRLKEKSKWYATALSFAKNMLKIS